VASVSLPDVEMLGGDGLRSERRSESAWNAIDAATSRLEEGWWQGNPPDVAELVPADRDLATPRVPL